MKLYDYVRAPSARKIRILFAEKDIPVEIVTVDLSTNEQLGEEYRAVNPFCTVPALQLDDGSVLTDTAGIIAYAEAIAPEPALLGHSALDKAEIASWRHRIELDGFFAVAEALRNSAAAMTGRAVAGPADYEQIPELAERGRKRVLNFFELLDRHLEHHEYITADNFSMADIEAAVTVDFGRAIRMEPHDNLVNLQRWRSVLSERPSFAL